MGVQNPQRSLGPDISARPLNLVMAKKQAVRVHFSSGTGSSPEDLYPENIVAENPAELKGAGQSTKRDQEMASAQDDHCTKNKPLQERIHWLEQRVIKLQLQNQSLIANAGRSRFFSREFAYLLRY